MLKIFGALLIVSASGLWGFSKSQNLKKRAENLSRIASCLVLLENEISYGQKDIKGVLSSIGTLENLPFFTEFSKNIGAFSIQKVFSCALSKCNMCLSKADKLTLLEFFQTLGSLNSESQIKSIIHTRELLKTAQCEAYEEYKKYGSLYRNMGLLLGALFSLILF